VLGCSGSSLQSFAGGGFVGETHCFGASAGSGRGPSAELRERHLDVPVLMGGVLNQKTEDQALPVDVTAELRQLGFHCSAQLDSGWGRLLTAGDA